MSLLDQRYVRGTRLPQQHQGYTNYPVNSIYNTEPTEIDATALLNSIPKYPTDDSMLLQLSSEIYELEQKLEAIDQLKKVEKPLRKRLNLLMSFLNKLIDAQKELIDTNVTVIQSNEVIVTEEPKELEDFSMVIPEKNIQQSKKIKKVVPPKAKDIESIPSNTEGNMSDFL